MHEEQQQSQEAQDRLTEKQKLLLASQQAAQVEVSSVLEGLGLARQEVLGKARFRMQGRTDQIHKCATAKTTPAPAAKDAASKTTTTTTTITTNGNGAVARKETRSRRAKTVEDAMEVDPAAT